MNNKKERKEKYNFKIFLIYFIKLKNNKIKIKIKNNKIKQKNKIN